MGSRSRKKILGALATAAGGTISQLAILGAKEGSQSRRDKVLAAREERMLGLGQKFKTAERIAGEEFKEGESALERETREGIAGAKTKAATDRATQRQQAEINRAIPKFATDLLELKQLPRKEFAALVGSAQQFVLEGKAKTESEALRMAARDMKIPEVQAALKAAGLELPGTTAPPAQKSFTGTLVTQAQTPLPQSIVSAGIDEQAIQDTMQAEGISRPEAIKIAEQLAARRQGR